MRISPLNNKILAALLVVIILLNLEFFQAEADIDWSKETQSLDNALEYIENKRKLDVNIKFTQRSSGKPLSNVEASYQQTSHDFMFALGGADLGDPSAYQLRNEMHLNSFEIWPLNWTYIEPSEGVYNFQKYDSYLESMQQFPSAQFFVKLWTVPEPGWINRTGPPSYTNFTAISDPTAFQKFLTYDYDYIFHVAQHFKGKIRFWLTQMEINAPIYTKGETDKTLWTIEQAVEINYVTAKAIRDADPDATIILGTSGPEEPGFGGNDFADPLTFTKMCLTRGVDFDGVAIEAWQSWGTPSFYYDYYKELTDLGKCVFIHEIEGFAAQPYDWASSWKWNVFDETSQAEWLRYMYTVAYGSKGVLGMQWLWYRDEQMYQKGVYYANGLIDQNGSPRESFSVFKEVISQFTTKGNGTTDENGFLNFRGFAGSYSVQLNIPDRQKYVYNFTVSEKGSNIFEVTGPDFPAHIKMKILDLTNEVSGATVVTIITPTGQNSLSGVSDEIGEYVTDNILPGNYTFEISKEGYKTRVVSQSILGDQVMNLAVTLEKVFDFTIDVTPSSLKIIQGESGEGEVSVGSVSGSGSVTLSSEAPVGIYVSVTPDSGSPPFKSVARINVAQNVKAGSYSLVFAAESEGKSYSKQVTLVVEEKLMVIPGYGFEIILIAISVSLLFLFKRMHR